MQGKHIVTALVAVAVVGGGYLYLTQPTAGNAASTATATSSSTKVTGAAATPSTATATTSVKSTPAASSSATSVAATSVPASTTASTSTTSTVNTGTTIAVGTAATMSPPAPTGAVTTTNDATPTSPPSTLNTPAANNATANITGSPTIELNPNPVPPIATGDIYGVTAVMSGFTPSTFITLSWGVSAPGQLSLSVGGVTDINGTYTTVFQVSGTPGGFLVTATDKTGKTASVTLTVL